MDPPADGAESGDVGDDDAAADAALAALRAIDAPRIDPLGYETAQALARRAARHDGEVRRLLARRVADAVDRCRTAVERAAAGRDAPAADRVVAAVWAPGPLAELVRRLDAGAAGGGGGAGDPAGPDGGFGGAGASPATSDGLRSARRARGTWTRLAVERQLARSIERGPDRPGPLNSHALVLRALQRMQALSPAYLDAFVEQVETLLWLERAAPTAGPPAPATPGSRSAAAAAPPRPSSAGAAGRSRRRRGPGAPAA